MPASKHLRVLSVRLPESDIRRFKSLAAQRSMSLQEAVHQALQSWALQISSAPHESIGALRGSLADVNIAKLIREEKEHELKKERQLY